MVDDGLTLDGLGSLNHTHKYECQDEEDVWKSKPGRCCHQNLSYTIFTKQNSVYISWVVYNLLHVKLINKHYKNLIN